ncbi:hypothetical protein [Estrella lausannensis]|uniref:Uncharacterized protein n=1 Tax=Estrella lausannensis TaxID=483423 RepID=A0A0H5DN21_9BACT|nr:hypothetical protein [Estrella lausannensis]CRX37452.1 hypothetical protein ELAC_0089 [Estrella lausannensis]
MQSLSSPFKSCYARSGLAGGGVFEDNEVVNSRQQHQSEKISCLLNTLFRPREISDLQTERRRLGSSITLIKDMVEEIKEKQEKGVFQDEKSGSFCLKNIIDIIVNAMTELYEILGTTPLPQAGRHNLRRQQLQLAHSSLVAEERRFNLMPRMRAEPEFAGVDAALFPRNEGGNRFLTQISFLTFLESNEGRQVLDRLKEEINPGEIAVFSDTIDYLTRVLAPGYIKLLSQIETEKYLDNIRVIKTDESEYYPNLERKLREIIKSYILNNEGFMLPFGWALPGGSVGHHMLLWGDRSESLEGHANIRYIDTTQIAENDTLPKTQAVAKSLKRVAGLETTALINPNHPALLNKKCSVGFSNVSLAKVINRAARIILLQIPKFAEKTANTTTDDLRMFLLKINYSLGTTEKPLVDEESPLSRWKWYKSPSCALETFQPLLQEIAKKFLRDKNINDRDVEQHLRGCFALLMQSYKASLVNKFLDEGSPGISRENAWLGRAYRNAIYQVALETIHEDNLVGELSHRD